MAHTQERKRRIVREGDRQRERTVALQDDLTLLLKPPSNFDPKCANQMGVSDRPIGVAYSMRPARIDDLYQLIVEPSGCSCAVFAAVCWMIRVRLPFVPIKRGRMRSKTRVQVRREEGRERNYG